jgi:hypothetical protein
VDKVDAMKGARRPEPTEAADWRNLAIVAHIAREPDIPDIADIPDMESRFSHFPARRQEWGFTRRREDAKTRRGRSGTNGATGTNGKSHTESRGVFCGKTPNGARRLACRPRCGTGGEIDG